jgi:hypothetical protein
MTVDETLHDDDSTVENKGSCRITGAVNENTYAQLLDRGAPR